MDQKKNNFNILNKFDDLLWDLSNLFGFFMFGQVVQ